MSVEYFNVLSLAEKGYGHLEKKEIWFVFRENFLYDTGLKPGSQFDNGSQRVF
jgi:hypothetical protein